MGFLETYEYWKTDEFFSFSTRKELEELTDAKEIEDRFYRDLEFGTGGLRGIMGWHKPDEQVYGRQGHNGISTLYS